MIQIHPLQEPIRADVALPGSLSYTIRALNLAAMTPGPITLHHPLFSDDTAAMMECLRTLGIDVETGTDFITVHGDISSVADKDYTLNIGISGRTARTLLATLCIVPGVKTVTCDSGFRKRPVSELVNGLRQLGATIEYLENDGFLPVKISSSTLKPGTVTMDGSISSQYFSGIMMIAPLVGEIEIHVTGEQASKPFIDVTIATMKEFGVVVENRSYNSYKVAPGQHYSCTNYTIEADAISASYFWGIAALTGSMIRVLNLSPNSSQGDVKFADILEKMGCSVRKNTKDRWIEVTGPAPADLKAVTVDMNDTPDSVQTLAVVAAYAKGTTHITGLSHLKVKETDRIEAPAAELRKMGVTVEATADSLTITGATAKSIPHGAEIKTYGDHRMAMSFALAGLRTPGIRILNPEVVSKSFPTFWELLKTLGIQLTGCKNCLICGFRGTGKSSIGPLVAQALGWNYIEMDFYIAHEAGKPIAEITKNGTSWQEFRERETELLKEVLDMENVVISAGGGVGVNDHVNSVTGNVFGEEQLTLIKAVPFTKTIVLSATPEVIAQRLRNDEEKKEVAQRPLLNEEAAKELAASQKSDSPNEVISNSDHIEKIIADSLDNLKQREPRYKQLSDSIIDTSTVSIQEAAAQIVTILKQ